MTRYSDLVSEWWNARMDSIRFEDEHRGFTARLVTNLVSELQVPAASFAYIPFEGDPEPNTKYGIAAASGFAEDRWFHVRFVIQFQIAPNVFPIHPVAFDLATRRKNGAWEVRIHPDGSLHQVDDTDEGRRLYADVFFGEVRPFLSSTLRDYIEKGTREKRVGFTLPAIDGEGGA